MSGEARPLRADAQRNRTRVLEAAEAVLARDGLSASMRAIAQKAGVGLGTIYRHFPTQEDLYRAIVTDRTRRLAEEAHTLSAAEDPGAAFFAFFTRIVVNAARNKPMADILVGSGVDPKAAMAEGAPDMRSAIETLLVNAQKAGAVRQDLRMPELLALLAGACLVAERNQWSDELRDRALGILFDGLRPNH
ncbi:TetR family transcriptional regulator [Planotetraspora thailandica]|uniref:TetR family transcriptional regulator n=1 Tax=Planotetraspora thailandica TaxID=487172 RepID=A0A8J3V028_9ACTN|nr:TetR/AcrR family transcriptional regulator [Planotetraspora thailandica]GII53770.1 TetR family transcriptional regulator [Planotetraspora thailandica]